MWAVSEVVWAALRGRNVPVPYRLTNLTRYLKDTLKPSGPAFCSPHMPTRRYHFPIDTIPS